jgi:hypothetical protein
MWSGGAVCVAEKEKTQLAWTSYEGRGEECVEAG